MLHPFATHVGARRLVTAAIAAPSVHNTQPWRFHMKKGGVLELHADMDRRLPVIDPYGRALHISCGAALLNLRLAIRVTEHRPLVEPIPDALGEPALLSSIRAVEAPMATLAERELYASIPLRRTNRRPFKKRWIPQEIRRELVAAARAERVALSLPQGQVTSYLISLIAAADRELSADADYRAELARWTADSRRSDGVPWYAFGPRPGQADGMPVRDFGLARQTPGREVDRFRARPQLGVLMTTGDEPEDWLRAGQALQRVLLTATRHGVSASLMNQPLDLRDRGRAPGVPRPQGHIQAIIRFGYGPPVPGSPRRPFAEVIERTTPIGRPSPNT